MSDYDHPIVEHYSSTSFGSSEPIKERKEARKKLLADIEQRRRENYLRFIQKKRRLQPSDDML